MHKSVNFIVDKLIITSAGKRFLAMYNKISSYLNHRHNYQFIDANLNVEKKVIHFFKDLVVKDGLYAGMKYPSFKSVCSAMIPKLSGTYENELSFVFERLKKNKYDLIVDIGCAEGYYAVGLAMIFPNTPIYAFDIDLTAQQLCREMALLNQVQDQVITNGECTIENLSSLVKGKRCLIISDCEGYEEELFTSDNTHMFSNCDLIIELHPFENKNIKKEIYNVLSTGHQVQFISSLDTNRKAFELSEEYIHFLSEQKAQVVNEARPFTMDWLVASPVKWAL